MFSVVDNSTLSSLIFNHLNSGGAQYGFLVGERAEHVEKKISDSQIYSSDVSSFIYVSSFIPWFGQNMLYDKSGCFKEQEIINLLSKTEQNLVGWYSFRHQSTSKPSLREVSLHKKLLSLEKYITHPDEFIFFLSTSTYSQNISTHICSHGFLQLLDRHFVGVPMIVMNLGDTTRKEYRRKSSATFLQCHSIQGSLSKLRNDFLESSGEMNQRLKIKNLSCSFNKGLSTIHTKIAESEELLGLLEADINILKHQLEELEKEEMDHMMTTETKKYLTQEEAAKVQNIKKEAQENKDVENLFIHLGISSETSISISSCPFETFYMDRSEKIDGKNETVCSSSTLLTDAESLNTNNNSDSLSNQTLVSKKELDKNTKIYQDYEFVEQNSLDRFTLVEEQGKPKNLKENLLPTELDYIDNDIAVRREKINIPITGTDCIPSSTSETVIIDYEKLDQSSSSNSSLIEKDTISSSPVF
ncbi:BRCA1-A complex subunit Abraxas 1-like [Physella acuta]|uniref:BRCA1-A complex subunit Abraxas 1-like n=1 Tax=Physella acuta TaxID=109671 RepID=UPI0027DDCA37|nr:BRCA1-A complex subunit Abraxas 1-like [Physella acuta]